MKNEILNIDASEVKSFVEENTIVIAAIGGVVLGVLVASMLGNTRAKSIVRSAGNMLSDATGRFVNNLGGYKDVIAPMMSKTETQGL